MADSDYSWNAPDTNAVQDTNSATEQQPPAPLVTPDSSSPNMNLANWNSGLAGYLNGLANSANSFTPQQRQQFAATSLQLTQDAANRAMKAQSPLHKIGNILGGVGAAISGIAPGSGQNSFSNFANLQQNARNQTHAEDQRIISELKLAQQASQMGTDPKVISQIINGFKTGTQGATAAVNAANKKQQIDNLETYRTAMQGIRAKLADNQIEHWQTQDAEAQRNHNLLYQQKQWVRESINSIEQDRLKLTRYRNDIMAGKATADTQTKAQRLAQEMQMKQQAINQGIQKFNVKQQFELSKTVKGKPVYQDANGNVPTYEPIPMIGEQQQQQESAPLSTFPQEAAQPASPELNGAPSPPGMQAQAQSMPQQAPQQGAPTSIGAQPISAVPNLPTGATTPPPPARQLLSHPPSTPAAASRQTSSVKSAKDTAAAAKPDSRKKAEAAYYQLVGKGMDPKAAFAQAKKENPY